MEQIKNKIASKLQTIKENELTKTILVPLFEALGYHKVEFFGGNSEEGKDILLWEIDKFGDIKLIVAQVKHFKFTNRASDSRSLQTVINQLTTSLTKYLIYTDQQPYQPSEAFLITTYPVSTKTLLTHFDTLPNLQGKKIKIVDGLRLASLLMQKKPSIVKELLGIEIDISTTLSESLSNEALLRALGSSGRVDLKNIYTDLDFSIGKKSTKFFFHSTFYAQKRLYSFNPVDWKSFLSICDNIQKEIALTALYEAIKIAEFNYSQSLIEYKKWERELSDVSKRVSELSSNLELKYDKIGYKKLKDLMRLEQRLQKSEPTRIFKVEIDGYPIINELIRIRKWVDENVALLNAKQQSLQNIKKFVLKCKSILDCTSLLFITEPFAECIGFEKKKKIRTDFESTRLKFSIDQILDTGLNITLLGEAGAGKTTSLQIYAQKNAKNNEKLIIFLPLANVMQYWAKEASLMSDEEKVKKLDECIAYYLMQKGIPITSSDFYYLLSNRKMALLFDGLDETIKLNPWLPEAITNLANNYSANTQVVISSRSSGKFLESIPFFSVSLLPFTPEQVNIFIDNWFSKENSDKIVLIKEHLKKNKAIREIIRNPLLTTILCILAENEIDLPKKEKDLYDERLKLLSGEYDHIRNIPSRLSSRPSTLLFFARKLAFYFHSKIIRDAELSEIKEQITRFSIHKYGIKETELALTELIDPCNILTPMTDYGTFGFGHLRFQEHLAATELILNRGIEVAPFLNQIWWRGTLLLYAQMESDLTYLIHKVEKMPQTDVLLITLSSMVKMVVKPEQERLKTLMKINRIQFIDHGLETSGFNSE
ncbi:MAG TPA: NACHT domain-containing protein [Chitinophagaceae bacterium]|nr:NACHT domain-containing protein [Chitinophagaceae bacterium]